MNVKNRLGKGNAGGGNCLKFKIIYLFNKAFHLEMWLDVVHK